MKKCVAELVANHFDIAVAFVGLLDEAEERFVACHGADWTLQFSVGDHDVTVEGTGDIRVDGAVRTTARTDSVDR